MTALHRCCMQGRVSERGGIFVLVSVNVFLFLFFFFAAEINTVRKSNRTGTFRRVITLLCGRKTNKKAKCKYERIE